MAIYLADPPSVLVCCATSALKMRPCIPVAAQLTGPKRDRRVGLRGNEEYWDTLYQYRLHGLKALFLWASTPYYVVSSSRAGLASRGRLGQPSNMTLICYQCPSSDHVESSLRLNNDHWSQIKQHTGEPYVSAQEINLSRYLQKI